MSILQQVVTNNILLACLIAWLVSQVVKTIIDLTKEKKLDLLNLAIGTGGMPSSHTAATFALTTSILLTEGVTTLFVVASVFTIIVMRDALGIRREAGKHAEILNKITKSVYKNNVDKFNEFLGHTPSQVVVGAIIGVLTAILII